MRTRLTASSWIAVLVCSVLSSSAFALTVEEAADCQRRGLTNCDLSVVRAAQAGPTVAVPLIDTLPAAHKESVAVLYKLFTDASAGDGSPIAKRKADIAERLTQFMWEDHVGVRKIPKSVSNLDKDQDLAGVSHFIGTPVAWENEKRKKGVRMADRNAVNAWVTFPGSDEKTTTERWMNVVVLYYALGACARATPGCSAPSWVSDELAGKLKGSSQAYFPRLIHELHRWTRPSPAEKEAPAAAERPAGELAESDMARRAYTKDERWIDKFLAEAAAKAAAILRSDEKGPAAAQRLRVPWQASAPGAPRPGAGPTATVPGGADSPMWTVDRQEALGVCDRGSRDCGGKVAYLYQENGVWHPISIRVIRVRNDQSRMDGDYIQIIDMVPYAPKLNRYHLIPLGMVADEWDFPSGVPGKVHHYRMEMRTAIGPDGQPRQWIFITNGHGRTGDKSMAPPVGDDSFGAVSISGDPAEDARCNATRGGQIDNSKCMYGVTFQSLVRARARQCETLGRTVKIGSHDYCVVTQLAPRLCYQFIRMEGASAVPDCSESSGKCGVACVKQKDDEGNYAMVNDGTGVYIGNFEGTEYCLKRKAGSDNDWEVYKDNGCKKDLDPPFSPPPKKPEKEEKTTTGPAPTTTQTTGEDKDKRTPTTAENPQLTDDPQKYLDAIKEQFGAVIGNDSTAKWDIAFFQTGRNANSPYFFLLYANKSQNKSISFPGVLLCQSSTLCLLDENNELLVRTASIPKDKLDGGDMRWLDLGQKDADGNYKAAGNGKFYPISGTTVFHIPKDGLTSLVSNPRKATPASRLSAWEDNEQTPTVKSGTYVLHVGARDEGEWKRRLQKLWQTSGEGSHFFSSQHQENRAKVEAFIAREIAKDKAAGIKDDEWDPIVEIKMFTKQADKDFVVEYTGRGLKSGDGKHPCKLWWIYTRRPNGELKEEC